MELSKGEFARRRGVTPAAVSQWISSGKLSGDALVGSGRYARINVEEAERQLTSNLDPGQQLSRPATSEDETQASGSVEPASAPSAQTVDEDQQRYRRAKTESAEIELRRARRRELEELGRYMETDRAREAWAKEIGSLIVAIERWHADLSIVLASEKPATAKETTAVVRREWNDFRAKRRDLALASAAAEEELVTDSEPV